ncbi:uncharacterized protein METZ01_LOCUS96081, partial [marine metagenome]
MNQRAKKYFVVAGDPSGDIHGGKLISAIQNIEPDSSFVGHGGDLMKESGMRILRHTNDLAIMGFVEVVRHLPRLIKIMRETIEAISRLKPDRVILIDYPGFNLHLAKNIHRLGIPITYFILPQAWAWRKKRIESMKKFLDQSISIFPFEQTWYESQGLPTHYIGHPFVERDHIGESSKEYHHRHNLNDKYPILVLLPGSRQQEIKRHWPIFLKFVNILKTIIPNLQIVVGKAPNTTLSPIPNDFKIDNNARKAMMIGTAALVSSGTATLECAVENIPLIVCYKLSSFSWWLTRKMVNVKYASMVNLIGNEKIVPEYLQKA